MSDSTEYAQIQNISLDRLVEYVRSLPGWKLATSPSSRFQIFEGTPDDSGKPIELALPASPRITDLTPRIKDAVELLASVRDIEPIDLIREIQTIDRDILLEKIPTFEDAASISLKMASSAVDKLKNLVAYGTTVEIEMKAYTTGNAPDADVLIRKCQFGHTFRGSFGFTIEMPIPVTPVKPKKPDAEKVDERPLERKVMERIVRGLKLTHQAIREDNPDILVQNYKTAFNANMLTQVLAFRSEFPDVGPNYTMKWTPRFKVSKDVEHATNLVIERSERQSNVAKDVMKTAIKELKHSEEQQITEIIGWAEVLKKDIDPEKLLSDDETGITRLVTIKGEEKKTKKPVRLKVKLDYDDYRLACDAHKLNKRITIKGRLVRDGTRTSLVSPEGFAYFQE